MTLEGILFFLSGFSELGYYFTFNMCLILGFDNSLYHAGSISVYFSNSCDC